MAVLEGVQATKPDPPLPAARNDLADLICQRQAEIVDDARRGRPWSALRDPELRKVLCRLYWNLSEADRFLTDDLFNASDVDQLRRRLQRPLNGLRLEAAIEVLDAVDQILIRAGDDRFLYSWYVLEQYRDQRRHEMEVPFVTWSDLFGTCDGSSLEEEAASRECPPTEVLRRQLTALRRSRSTEYRLHRTRLAMRARTLRFLAPVLAVIVVGLGIAIVQTGQATGTREVVLSAIAGGLGATVSGMYKLRDTAKRIADVRALKPALYVQPLIGAAAGLVILLVAVSGFLPEEEGSTDGTWARYAVLAFVAGFSEPFFLGVVGRIAAPMSGTPSTASTEH